MVREGIRKSDGVKFAIKTIEKKYVQEKHAEQLTREINIMKKIDHPNVLKLIEIFEDDTSLIFVLEL